MKDLSLADLLKLLLSLPMDTPVYASPSFQGWLRTGETAQWPPASDANTGICLLDTRDRSVRHSAAGWERVHSGRDEAVLIITGTGPPGSALRRLLRRIRRPGMQRLDERRIGRFLEDGGKRFSLRLLFNDGLEVPTAFDLDDGRDSTGVAHLLTRSEAFSGSLMSAVAQQLEDPAFRVRSLQLRLRGAAIIAIRSRNEDLVIRAVPPGRSQEVVLRNHTRLVEIRSAIRNSELLDKMPEPRFLEMHEGFALLGETFLPGEPAWRLNRDLRRRATHPQAMEFLAMLAADTRESPAGNRGSLEGHLRKDLQRLDRAHFASSRVRALLRDELRLVAELVEDGEIEAATSHGDFGYGNLLADPVSGALRGVIDWDTARKRDFPGVDLVNLEIQIRRTEEGEAFPVAVRSVWENERVRRALQGGSGSAIRARTLFGLGVARYVLRSLSYPTIYRDEEVAFRAALEWLGSVSVAPAEVEAA